MQDVSIRVRQLLTAADREKTYFVLFLFIRLSDLFAVFVFIITSLIVSSLIIVDSSSSIIVVVFVVVTTIVEIILVKGDRSFCLLFSFLSLDRKLDQTDNSAEFRQYLCHTLF